MSRYVWTDIDWTQPNAEIAAALGCTPHAVAYQRSRRGEPVKRKAPVAATAAARVAMSALKAARVRAILVHLLSHLGDSNAAISRATGHRPSLVAEVVNPLRPATTPKVLAALTVAEEA